MLPTLSQLMHHLILARAPRNSFQQLVQSVFPAKSAGAKSVTLKTKFKLTIPREFPGIWWLF